MQNRKEKSDMKRFKLGMAIGLLLCCSSCYRAFDWEDPNFQSHIVLFSSICPDTTIQVYVSQSYSIHMPSIDTLDRANVSLYINGQAMDRSTTRPHSGDTVRLVAEAAGLPTAEGSTFVPYPIPIKRADVNIEENFTRFRVTLDDPAGETNYYGLQISRIDTTGQTWGLSLDTHSEPLFSHLSAGLIDDLIEQGNDYRLIIYPFTDQTMNGQRYTLQVTSPSNLSTTTDRLRFCIRLYTLTQDYYQYLLSVGLTNTDRLPEAGLADPTPIHHNVQNGLGLVGGYALSEQVVTLPGRE